MVRSMDTEMDVFPIKKKGKMTIVDLLKGKAQLNKYVAAAALTVVAVVSGPVFFNWIVMRRLLENMDAYGYLCINNPDDPTTILESDGTCKAQKSGIGQIWTMYVACQFGFSILSGILSDLFSAKLVSILGLVFQASGWLALVLSSAACPTYLLGAAFMGVGQDMSFIPLLGLRNRFPTAQATFVSILGTGRSIASFVPMFMEAISTKETTKTVVLTTMILSQVYSLITVYIFVPWSVATKDKPEEKVAKLEEGYQPENSGLMGLIRNLASPKFIFFVPCAIIAVCRSSWSSQISPHTLQALNAYSLASALSFIPCPLFGYLCDKISVFFVIHILNACGISMLSLYLIIIRHAPGHFLGIEYIIVVLFGLLMSFITSQIYCYVEATFPYEHTGRIIGILSAIGGLSSFMVQPLYEYGILVQPLNEFGSHHGFALGTYILMGIQILNIFLICYLHISSRKKIHH